MKNIKKSYFVSICFFIFMTSIISTFVSLRDISLVEDNIYYINNFLSKTSFDYFRYEFLFELITLLIRRLTDSYILYFFIINVILNSTLFFLGRDISNFYKMKYEFYIPLLFAFLILSSWYYSSATNGLRQGLSLSIVYLALVNLVLYNRLKTFLLLAVLACFFHYSTLLLIPFIFFYKLELKKLFFLVTLIATGYILNINELVVKSLSNTFNISLYQSIKNYVESSDAFRYGFQIDLFLYTFGLSLFYYLFAITFFKNVKDFNLIVKIYLILTIPYYLFGFAAFSNRYGVISWFFSVFINSTIFYFLFRRNEKLFYLLFSIISFISSIYFIYRYVGFV